VKMPDSVLLTIIREYTREAGVRELARLIGAVIRKITRRLIESNKSDSKVVVTVRDVATMLGPEKVIHDAAESKDQVGVAMGLAWTPVGGELLPIEVARMPGKGKLILTGQLGDVMRESAQAALSYARAYAARRGIEVDMGKEDLHIHLPSGAIKKDGPSAGIALTTALVSLFTQMPIRHEVAMTGEVTLRGKATIIGGLKEKSLAALRAGITTIIIPNDNKRDLADMPKEVKAKLKFIPVKTMDDVLKHALKGAKAKKR
jgi:ATP-dependent Lon protease